MGQKMPDDLLEELSRFIEVNMGLSFPSEKWADLEKGLHRVCEEFGCDSEVAFARHVMSSALSRKQVEVLAAGLTVSETYFFREKNALDAFEHLVLADLIRTRRDADRRIRIWSAGCSSGEEPYSIAMMLKMLLPDLQDWNISIHATDINPHSLEKAMDGVYTQWSFRDVPEHIMQRFFVKTGKEYEILPEIREMVAFSHLNLMKDEYPSVLNNTNAMDAIFCRNVLMYFAPETIQNVAKKFYGCLNDGGWLIVGQTELNDEYYQLFNKTSHAGALLFKKGEVKAENKDYPLPLRATRMNASLKPHPPRPRATSLAPAALPRLDRGRGEVDAILYENAIRAFDNGDYCTTEEILAGLINGNTENAKALSLLARVCANQGRLDDALRQIEASIRADSMNPGSHYLHAAILTEKGLKQKAMASLKKAVYLDADFALAYYAMGNIALGAGNMMEAERHFNSALLVLHKRGSDDILPESEGMTAGRMIALIETMKGKRHE